MDSHIWRYSASYKNMIEILIEATDINFKILSTGRNSLDQGNQCVSSTQAAPKSVTASLPMRYCYCYKNYGYASIQYLQLLKITENRNMQMYNIPLNGF